MSQANISRKMQLQIVQEKHDQLSEIMSENHIDCWIVFVRETAANPDPVMDLVVGGDIVWESAFIFLNRDEKLKKIAIVGNFDVPAEKRKGIWDVVISYKEGISKPLLETIKNFTPDKIALNYSEDDVVADGLSHGMFIKISQILAEYAHLFISAAPLIRAIRGKKSATEVNLITESCKLTEVINKTVTSKLKVGMSESEIQQLYYDEMDSLEVIEAWQRASCPAVDAGPDKEIGHVGPLDNSFTKEGHTLHNDFGVKLRGYCSDLQRMWFFGKEEELPEKLIHAFDTVRNAITKASEFIKPGVTGFSVDKVARDYIISRGYEEYAHALGHQVGIYAHDGGVLLGPLWERYGDTPKGLVEEGNIFTLELHVKTEHYGTVSLEENIVVTKDGCRFLVPPVDNFIFIK
ncbi:MAG: M24 family metallopeptidase [Candidatus Hodarchaeales archaeon]|jgi:Xaa-Pro aminopeptidase